MSMMLNNSDVMELASKLKEQIRTNVGSVEALKVYGIPRGGVPVAYLLRQYGFRVANTPEDADLFVDDVIDSGRTVATYLAKYKKPIYALVDKQRDDTDQWITFPWEISGETDDRSAHDTVIRLLQYIGEDPTREGLKETPERVLRAWQEWTCGYHQNPDELFKTFKDGSEGYDEMVCERELPFYSHCEHHLAPFFGTATIAYIPNGKVIGLSKLGRVLEVFSRRLQVQERLTVQIANSINEHLKPKGVGVIIKARHLCMESRGYNRQGHQTITSALRGVFMEGAVRQEFLSFL